MVVISKKVSNTIKIVFIILLLLFPLGQVARFEFQNGIAITLNDIFVGVVVAVWLMVGRHKKILKNPLSKPMFAFALIGFLSLIINIRFLNISDFLVSFLYGVRWIFYAALYFVVSEFELRFKKAIVIMMVLVGSLVVLGGYLQYFLYPNLRNLYYLGWDEHLYRMFSSFLDPNFAGAFFALYFILIFGLTIDFLKGNKKNYSLFLSLLSLITLLAILLTYSRSALTMLIVGSTTLLVLKKQKKIIFMILGIAVVFFVIASKNFYIENLNLLRTASSTARLESASNAVAIIRENPILGVGFNTYRYAQARHGFIKEDEKIVSHSAAGTDNSFLFVLATTGIVGFTFYLYMWFNILKIQGNKTMMGSVVIASTVGLFANAFFINSLFYPSIMLWMWVLIGLNPSTGLRLRGRSDSRSSGFKENK